LAEHCNRLREELGVQASGSRFFTRRYEAVMAHYEVSPQAIKAGKGHENGDAEQSQHRLENGRWSRRCCSVAAGIFQARKRR
jgi:hypothetical protein